MMSRNLPKPCWRKQQADEYMEKHKILPLFHSMTVHLLYHQPDKPKQFLARLLQEYRQAQAGYRSPPCIFDKISLQSMFQVMDPEGRGFINHAQYLNAMKALGLTDFCQNPRGHERDKIYVEMFVQHGIRRVIKVRLALWLKGQREHRQFEMVHVATGKSSKV